jgi:hypothetical protein
VDRRRLADVRAGTADQQHGGGSGYLVGQRLVLTCRHVVADDQGRAWPRLEIWLGHPGDGPPRRVPAEVVWVHPDPARDAALVRIEGEPLADGSVVRWGWFAGSDPVQYSGLGFPEFADYEFGRGVEQLGGTLPPLGMGADGGLVLDQGSAPEAAGRAWPGVSGAAVFCQGLLTAVVVRDDRAFGNRRLHAVPASVLTAEPQFARLISQDTGIEPALEAVEFAEFLQSPVSPFSARTPGSLLAAPVEAVKFTGRSTELAELAAWRDGSEGFSVMLVSGEGGQGKTRLARHFAVQTLQARWAAGFLAARTSRLTGDGRDQLPSTAELAWHVRKATRPVLLIADYAEIRPDEITALTDILAGSPSPYPVRILLLSRTAGAWWANLTEALGPHLTYRISLEPLTEAGAARRDAYAAAVTGLARRLAALPASPAERPPGQPWTALAEHLIAHPPGLDDPRLGNALSLQITALTNLLDAGSGLAPADNSGERELIGHERGYLRRSAAKRKLFNPGMLSDQLDDDERAAEAWAALERALAGIILLGPCDTSQAHAIGALASQIRAADVANWLATLYPSPTERFRVSTVQPDRVAELLLGPILIQQRGLLSEIGILTKAVNDAQAALFALMRTATHPGFGQVGEQAAELITSLPAPFAIAAPVLAATVAQGGPLRDGLIRLGQQNPENFRQNAFTVIDHLPEISVSGALFSAALATEITDILRRLAATNPDAYLPFLAASLNNLGVRLSQAGQRQAALAPTREAVTVRRQLAEANPDAYLPDLAASLTNLGNHLADAGQRQAALAPALEAADIYRQLAETEPGAQPYLALALNNLGVRLADVGQWQAALAASREAVTTRRQLAETNPDAYLPDLATSLNNLGIRLAQAGQRQAALAPTQEAVTIRRQLAEANPDAYLPDLAMSLNNLGNHLADAGQRQAALAPAQEAVTIRRQLAEANPDAYLPDLAMSLSNLGARLAEAGQRQAALAPAQEAVTIRRQLAETEPDAYLPDLATSLTNLGNHLADAGQRQAALAPAQEAVTIRRQLAETEPDAYLPDLALALNNLGVRQADVGQQQLALASAQEAATIRRQLAETNPDAYLPDLATSLNNLGVQLAEAGQQQPALASTQEAVTIRRQLAEANPDAYLADLAMSLSNLGIRLADVGQQQAALAPAQEAVTIRRQLAEANPDAYLPDLAKSLNNLGVQLAEAGQQQAALAPAQEAVTIRRQLAETEPDAYLPDLAQSLRNLSARLTETGGGSEVGKVWESAIAGLPNEPSRLALTVAYAHWLSGQPDAGAGVELLVKVLIMPGAPGPVEADARRLLRAHWCQHPEAVERAWQSLAAVPMPDWMDLTDDDINTVIGWITTGTWAESRQYFGDRSDRLLAHTTPTVLDELALTASESLITQHRRLLDVIREKGLDGAYQPLLLIDTLREWMAAPSWDASRVFLHDHPELLHEDIPSLLANPTKDADPEITIHQALLTLAQTREGVDLAYQILQDVQCLQAAAREATAAQDIRRLQACANIEIFVHGHAFAGALHMILAWLPGSYAEPLPEGWVSELSGLAAQTDPAEKDTALADLNTALAGIPTDSAIVGQLRRILNLPDRL